MPFDILVEPTNNAETLYAVEMVSASFPRVLIHRSLRWLSSTAEEARARVKQHISYEPSDWVKVDDDLVWYRVDHHPDSVYCRVEVLRVVKVEVPPQVCVREEEVAA